MKPFLCLIPVLLTGCGGVVNTQSNDSSDDYHVVAVVSGGASCGTALARCANRDDTLGVTNGCCNIEGHAAECPAGSSAMFRFTGRVDSLSCRLRVRALRNMT